MLWMTRKERREELKPLGNRDLGGLWARAMTSSLRCCSSCPLQASGCHWVPWCQPWKVLAVCLVQLQLSQCLEIPTLLQLACLAMCSGWSPRLLPHTVLCAWLTHAGVRIRLVAWAEHRLSGRMGGMSSADMRKISGKSAMDHRFLAKKTTSQRFRDNRINFSCSGMHVFHQGFPYVSYILLIIILISNIIC